LADLSELIEADVETYRQFDRSRREQDKTRLESDFNKIIEVSLKILEKSDSAFDWIKQLQTITPEAMIPHLLVACELIMGSINGTGHVVRSNIRHIGNAKKRADFFKRVDDLQEGYHKKYLELVDKLAY